MRFTGKTVAVTGASGGIGAAIAEGFAKEGARVVLLDLHAEAIEKTAAALPGEGHICLPLDVSDEQAVAATFAKIEENGKGLDVLVNAAGIPGPSATTDEYKFADFKRVYEVNVFGTFLCMQQALRIMRRQGSGSVVNFGSVSGMFGYPYEVGYGSSKWAVIGMTKNAANENGANGVRVNSVSPGWVDTAMMREVTSTYTDVGVEDPSENVTLGPMQRPATPEEMADAVLFLASDAARFANGTNLLVDGGMTLG